VRQILHIDMDAFFASVEQLDDPSLRGKPVIVGGASMRGVVSAASYEARAFGVHSAMPIVEARRRCPQGIVVSVRHDRYSEISQRVFAIFERFTPLVEGLSVDEAFLDVTGSLSLFGSGEVIAERIRAEIKAEIGLTASAGVAGSKFVAKIASDLKKPDGLVVVPVGEEGRFLDPLPIERMWGVGPAAAERLHAAGFSTIGDLSRSSSDRLGRLLGSWGRSIWELSRGIDNRPVEPGNQAQSMGAEETFEHDLTDRRDIERHLLAQCQRVGQRLCEEGLGGYVVTTKIKFSDFTLKSRQMRLPEPVFDTTTIYETARSLLDRFELAGARVRLVGVSVSELCEKPQQPALFIDAEQEKRKRLERVFAKVDEKFGRGSITRATLLHDEDGDE